MLYSKLKYMRKQLVMGLVFASLVVLSSSGVIDLTSSFLANDAEATNPFSSNEPWARVVESNQVFSMEKFADLTFNILVVRSEGTYAQYSVVKVGPDPYARYLKIFVDGVEWASDIFGYELYGVYTYSRYVGVLSPGYHEFRIQIYDGSHSKANYYLDYLALGNGNYVYPTSANAGEKQETSQTYAGLPYKMTSNVKFASQLVYETLYDPSFPQSFNLLTELTHTPSEALCIFKQCRVVARTTTISYYVRINDQLATDTGSEWISISSISAITSAPTTVQQWQVGIEYKGVGASYGNSWVSDSLPGPSINNPSGGFGPSWRSLGSLTKYWSYSDTLTTISAKATLDYNWNNAKNWREHNIEFEVDVVTDFYVYNTISQSWKTYAGTLTHTYIIGDGIGFDTPAGVTDRWVTILPGTHSP